MDLWRGCRSVGGVNLRKKSGLAVLALAMSAGMLCLTLAAMCGGVCLSPYAAAAEKTQASFQQAMELFAKAQSFKNAGNFYDALPVAEKSLSLVKELNGQKTVEYAAVLTLIGELLLYTGEAQKALEPLGAALLIWQDSFGMRRFDFARAAGLQAQAMGELGLYREAAAMFEDALAVYKDEPGPCSAENARLTYACGCLHFTHGEFALAKPYLLKATQVLALVPPEGDARVADALGKLAEIYLKEGDNKNAKIALLTATDIAYRAFGAASAEYVCSLENLADFYGKTGDRSRQKRYLTMADRAKHAVETAKLEKEKEERRPKCPPTR